MGTLLSLSGIFFSAFAVGFSGAIMPGPLFAVTIAEARRRGAWAGPLLIVGHAILEAFTVALLALGLVEFLKSDPMPVGLIGLAGGALLAWMGADMVRAARKVSLQEGETRGTRMHPVVAGIVMSVSNPYWALWWLGIGSLYVTIGARFGALGIVVFFLGHILSDFVWYTFVSVAVARGRSIIPDRAFRWIITVCGAGLVFFGVWFVRTGATTLGAGKPCLPSLVHQP